MENSLAVKKKDHFTTLFDFKELINRKIAEINFGFVSIGRNKLDNIDYAIKSKLLNYN